MPAKERGIVFTNDLDGVHFVAPPPFKTTLKLLQKDLALPTPGTPIGEYTPHPLSSRWSIFFHQIRPIKKEALEGLEVFRQAAEEEQRQLSFAALSGREKDKHDMTRERLQQTGYMRYFTDLYLNQGKSSSAWKESVVRKLTENGVNVVHIDDDIRAGLSVARINNEYPDENRVLVYIIRNLSNNAYLIRRSGVEIPDNLQFVTSFLEAAHDFSQKLHEKAL